MKKSKTSAKTRCIRRTFHTTPEINKSLLAAADNAERPAAWIINQALKQYLGINQNGK